MTNSSFLGKKTPTEDTNPIELDSSYHFTIRKMNDRSMVYHNVPSKTRMWL